MFPESAVKQTMIAADSWNIYVECTIWLTRSSSKHCINWWSSILATKHIFGVTNKCLFNTSDDFEPSMTITPHYQWCLRLYCINPWGFFFPLPMSSTHYRDISRAGFKRGIKCDHQLPVWQEAYSPHANLEGCVYHTFWLLATLLKVNAVHLHKPTTSVPIHNSEKRKT